MVERLPGRTVGPAARKSFTAGYDRVIDAENWSRANFFEQRATEYAQAAKLRRLGWA
jgi:hypothetical protein